MGINWRNLFIFCCMSLISTFTIKLNGGPDWFALVGSLALGAILGFLQGAGLINMPIFEEDKDKK